VRQQRFFLSVAVGFLCAAPSVQAQEKADVSLTYRAFRSDREVMELSPMGGGISVLNPVRDLDRIEGYDMPLRSAAPVFFALRLKGMQQDVVGLLSKSVSSARIPDRLQWDANHDYRFAGEESVKGRAVNSGMLFGPIRLTTADGPLPAFYFLIRPDFGYSVAPVGLYGGIATPDGKKVKVGFVEDITGGKGNLLIDYNGDGVFRGSRIRAWDNEAFYLPPLAQMPDGAWYRFQAAEDGSSLAFERDPTPTGKVRFTASRMLTGLLDSEGRLFYVRGTGGAVSIPAGNYKVRGVMLQQPDAKGKMWSALLSMNRDNFRLQVVAGQSAQLQCGPPFVMRLKARQDYRKVIAAVYQTEKAVDLPDLDPHDMAFDLTLTDRAGNHVDIILAPGGNLPPEPTAKILAADGHTLHTASFHYG
jgi:hypothetical protein